MTGVQYEKELVDRDESNEQTLYFVKWWDGLVRGILMN